VEPSGIVIGACPDGSSWLDDLLASINTFGLEPIVVDKTWDFELHSITLGAERFREFAFLPYSTLVLDNSLWEIVFDKYKGTSVSLSQSPVPFGYYMGKYLSSVVKEVGCPRIRNKAEAIGNESQWTAKYVKATGPYMALGDLPHSEVFEEKNGRLNMVVENQWLRRYKSCWDGPSQNREIARLGRVRRSQ
jgi:hypothetical protein